MDRQPHSPAPVAVSAETAARPRSLRRRLAWIAGALVLVLLLVLLPPLVSVNRYRREIAATMSASLGRPVHLDNVTLHLFPTLGFTLSNLVVSEDPAFGAEPTIRANTVEVTLRLASLWRRPVEFSTVRFIEPSVNLVRSPGGGWNLSGLLLHASHVNSAPTGQPTAGPAPRFPYIEATNGRVNLKLGSRKLPFSLTAADFALWLPSPQQWRLRLQGHPMRTDVYITDPGTLRIEGQLRRASTTGAVPLELTGSWHDAPLGEASQILFGHDLGWRGTLNLDVALAGQLADARLTTQLTLGGLRRADFFPAHPLDLRASCTAHFNGQADALHALHCGLPDDAPQPLTLTAAELNLANPAAADLSLDASHVPLRWAMLWGSLFSPRIPVDTRQAGTLDLALRHGGPAPPAAASAPRSHRHRDRISASPELPSAWSGDLRISLAAMDAAPDDSLAVGARPGPVVLDWRVEPFNTAGLPALRLGPTPVRLGPTDIVTLAGLVSRTGYNLSVSGTASPAAVLQPARYLPQLGDGLETVLPFPPTSPDPVRLNFNCSHTWGTPQTCTGPRSLAQAARTAQVPAPDRVPSSVDRSRPTLLQPRSLSPYDRATPPRP